MESVREKEINKKAMTCQIKAKVEGGNKSQTCGSVKRRKWSNGASEEEGKKRFWESHRTANGDYHPAKRRDKTGKMNRT